MFSFLRRPRQTELTEVEPIPVAGIDPVILAVIAAAVTRFREADATVIPESGFIVRRIRRV